MAACRHGVPHKERCQLCSLEGMGWPVKGLTAFGPAPEVYGPGPVKLPESTFVKADGGKLQWHLMPWDAAEEVVRVLMFGAKKYAPNNWALCKEGERYPDAAMRHLVSYMKGERVDGESKLKTLAHAACCVLFQLALDIRGEGKKT